MGFKQRIIYSLLVCVFLPGPGGPLLCRQVDNPFDLVPRIEKPVAPTDSAGGQMAGASPGNPFDIIREPTGAPPVETDGLPAHALQPGYRPADNYRSLKLFVILGILALLAFLLTVLRSLVHRSIMAFANDTVMNQLFRDQESRGLLPFLLLYAIFFLNAGVYIFFLLRFFDVDLPIVPFRLLAYCIFGVSAFFLSKHLALTFLGYVFVLGNEMKRYNFTIVIFGIVIGLFLVPVNIFMAYATPEIKSFIVPFSLGMVALIYLFRYLRSLIIANKFFLFHKFHFLLYICTVEMAPILFLIKLAMNAL